MAVLPAANRIATAQIYPTRQVHLIVGFPPGFAPDIVARLIAPALSERLGQQIVVDNRPGAASNIATELVVKANPDGYSLLLSGGANAINETLYENKGTLLLPKLLPQCVSTMKFVSGPVSELMP
jgi:tripartite-type tricarboxylate transporter receptor subunit TctC